MAHRIYKKEMKQECPRCHETLAVISTLHFGGTYRAECSGCGFGQVTADSEEIALARLHGKRFEYLDLKKCTDKEK